MNKQLAKKFILTFLILHLYIFNCISQGKPAYVDTIEVGSTMNTYIKIKSLKVLSLDMGGDENVIFEMDNGIIKMKAIKLNFIQSNFLVIARDTLLQFLVKFNKNPKQTIYEYDFNQIKAKNKPIVMIANAPLPNTKKEKLESSFSSDPLSKIVKLKSDQQNEFAEKIGKQEVETQLMPDNNKVKNDVSSVVTAVTKPDKKTLKLKSKEIKTLAPLKFKPEVIGLQNLKGDLEVRNKKFTNKDIIDKKVNNEIKVNVIKQNPVALKNNTEITKLSPLPGKEKEITKSKLTQKKVIATNNTKNLEKAKFQDKIKDNENKVQNLTTLNFLRLLQQQSNIEVSAIGDGIKAKLSKIYLDEKYIYFYIAVYNSTPIDYIIDYVNFEVKSKEKIFSSSSKQSIYPNYLSFEKNATVVEANDNTNLLYSIEKFALRNDEVLVFSIFEKSNASKGRSYEIKITSSDFNKIKKLPNQN